MFTGIIEEIGVVAGSRHDGTNIHFTIRSLMAFELKVDQSVAHDGVCLTVTEVQDNQYTVCAVQETLDRTSLQNWAEGTAVNLERAMLMGARLDGHMVQGHVDLKGTCTAIHEHDGSRTYAFEYDSSTEHITVPKGSICINGISLTVVESAPGMFSVVVIPYTYEHTNFKDLSVGDEVNLEFDVIGKYVARILADRS